MSSTVTLGISSTISINTTLDPLLSSSSTELSSTTTASPSKPIPDFYLGLILAVGSSFFIGSSFILQKLGLKSASQKDGGSSASEGGHKYLCEWKWWLGLLLMVIGEACNFVAFAFAPATLVTPLGALSVIFSAILASHFLKERLNLLGKIGCLLCILGSTVMVIHSPKSAEIKNMDDLLEKVRQPGILALVGVLIVAAAVAIIFFAPRWGSSNVVVYVFICSTLGALTVTGCKGVGVALKQTFEGDQQFTNWLTYVMLGVVAVNILFQLHFLNKALDTFNTAVVTPTYYVMFTSAVTIVSLVLFNEFSKLSVDNIIGNFCGFLTIVCGIFLLNVFKDMHITLRNIPNSKKKVIELDIRDGKRFPPLLPDNTLILQWDENESEDEEPPLFGGYDNPAFVGSREPLDEDVIRVPKVTFNETKVLLGNGHVDHLEMAEKRHSYSYEEVTHF